jgi:hypothetical protein
VTFYFDLCWTKTTLDVSRRVTKRIYDASEGKISRLRWILSRSGTRLVFDTSDIPLESRDDAKAWVIKNQLGRRNITAFTRAELVSQLSRFLRGDFSGKYRSQMFYPEIWEALKKEPDFTPGSDPVDFSGSKGKMFT